MNVHTNPIIGPTLAAASPIPQGPTAVVGMDIKKKRGGREPPPKFNNFCSGSLPLGGRKIFRQLRRGGRGCFVMRSNANSTLKFLFKWIPDA